VVELDALGFKIRFAEFFAFGAEITWANASAGLAFYEVANEVNSCSFVFADDFLHYGHQGHQIRYPRQIDPPM
jgi:hypothetical protein